MYYFAYITIDIFLCSISADVPVCEIYIYPIPFTDAMDSARMKICFNFAGIELLCECDYFLLLFDA